MVVVTHTPLQRCLRPPAPHRLVPDDNAFENFIARFNDPTTSNEWRCQKELAPLPPPVMQRSARACTSQLHV
ncbi:uncharacterized protein PHALS_01515 [Plasmopara halstedii]|uniref:Uncharacterized protein n=1 Tax=Plasmopara halstedii TaxID=4781 RepID=A0A0P1ASQ8_PLAHL|nr:uncharacterized protein PHALS_01515 [Plasmopara halstedii]CEG45200.1 hypothetical protein PHALS_01515 [Plasmopara halstedii]|eukprot:XP_024581569.1 hypothetical protein PHALS_01515 [Plasmopara halstedii]